MYAIQLKYKLLLFLFIVSCTIVISQEDLPRIEVLARPTKTSIKLRWAPNSPISWRETAKHGFIIERYTFVRDSVVLPLAEKTILTPKPIKPWPLEKWEKMVDTNDYAAIVAQAMFGESFEVTGAESEVVYMVNKARELESRFSFALFAASQSIKVAQASGLYYEDLTAKENEKYLYRIYSPIPEGGETIDTGFIYTGISDYSPLPPPVDFIAYFGDKTVMLKWNSAYYNRIFNNYIIERSSPDTLSFKALTTVPFVNTSSKEIPETPYMFKIDTLPENNVEYHYRVRGKTPFEEIGPPSKIESGMGIPSLEHQPYIQQVNIINNSATEITWTFSEEGIKLLKGYVIERTSNPNKPYTPVNDEPVDPNTFSYTDNAPQTVNYYRIKAVGKTGNESVSFPYLAQLEDSIPPAPPTGLQGEIDTTGIVTLTWDKNTEPDLLGYRVYRSNFANAEFGQITSHPCKRSLYLDSININTLTESMFYKIVAIDNRFNPSDFSETIELKRPDVVPPAPPAIKNTSADEEGVHIEWVNSNSEDVVIHLLYRRKTTENDWRLIAMFEVKDSINEYTDADLSLKDYYEYTMIAVDDNKLESEPTKVITLKRIDLGIRKDMSKFYATADRTNKLIKLQWAYNEPGVARYVIYKAREDVALTTYKSIPSSEKIFEDKDVSINTIYKYSIKAVFTNGDESPMSEEIEVNY